MTERERLPRLLHTSDAAKILGVSIAWLELKRWERQPPRFVRVGGPNGRAIYIEENTVDLPDPIG